MTEAFTAKSGSITLKNGDFRRSEYRNSLTRFWNSASFESRDKEEYADIDFVVTIYWAPIRDQIPLRIQFKNAFDYLHFLASLKSIQNSFVAGLSLHASRAQQIASFHAHVKLLGTSNTIDDEGEDPYRAELILDPEEQHILCKSNESFTEIVFADV